MAKRTRKRQPALASHYSEYKEDLRDDFDFRCGYCDITETEVGSLILFHIDHYKPKNNKLFPQFKALQHIYSNLIYSCHDCNGHKGAFWPNPIHKLFRKCEYVVNPCDEDPETHLLKSVHAWSHLTDTGAFNIKRLHLRNDMKIKCRQQREKMEHKLAKTRSHRNEAQARLAQAVAVRDQDAIDHFNDSIDLMNEAIDECNKFLARKLL